MIIALAIFLGGGLGSLARFGVSKLNMTNLPIGTLIANVLSCIVFGAFVYLFSNKIESSSFWKYFVVFGFCGGFSTFSTFSYETFNLIKNDQLLIALLNILVSVTFCLGVFYFFKSINQVT